MKLSNIKRGARALNWALREYHGWPLAPAVEHLISVWQALKDLSVAAASLVFVPIVPFFWILQVAFEKRMLASLIKAHRKNIKRRITLRGKVEISL